METKPEITQDMIRLYDEYTHLTLDRRGFMEKLTKRAARHRFDWPDAAQVLDKIEEEIRELRLEIDAGAAKERVADELGDLLLAVANLGRKLEVDPEAALRAANDKFTRRFQRVEALLRERGRTPGESTLAEMDALWDQVKAEERR